MTSETQSINLPDLRRSFIDLCRPLHLVDKKKKWIYLDRLWWNEDSRKEYANIVTNYIQLLLRNENREKVLLLTPDTISTSYGASPVVFIAADRLGCPIAVWEEMGDFFRRQPLIIGTEGLGKECLVIQDVIKSGTTILKMMNSLKKRQWEVIGYIGLVLNCSDQIKLEATKYEYKKFMGNELAIEYLVNLDELY